MFLKRIMRIFYIFLPEFFFLGGGDLRQGGKHLHFRLLSGIWDVGVAQCVQL